MVGGPRAAWGDRLFRWRAAEGEWTMPESTLGSLLTEALDLAWTVEPPELRAELLEAVGAAALGSGALDLAREVLLDLDDPLGCAWLHALMADTAARTGEAPGEALRHLLLARDGLRAPKRWRARPGWMGPDIARARLFAGLAGLGAVEEALVLLPHIGEGRLPRAQALAALCAACPMDVAYPGLGAPWSLALAAADRIADPDDARVARRGLAAVALAGGRPDRALDLARSGLSQGLPGLLVAAEVGELLLGDGALTAALALWEAAVDAPAAGGLAGADALCRLLEARLVYGDEEGAVAAFDSFVRRVARDPLPPEPQSPYAWRPLYALATRRRPFAPALRDALRRQDVVPPAWCYALGQLEIITGQAERARRAAAALEASAAAGPPEAEPLVYGALLRAAVGDLGLATRAMHRTLGEWPAPLVVDLPGQGPEPVERLFTRALVSAGALVEALDLSRTVGLPLLRAELLVHLAGATAEGGAPAAAIRLYQEAEGALDEARHRGEVASAASLVGRLAAGLAAASAGGLAESALQRFIRSLSRLPDELALPALIATLPALAAEPALLAVLDRAALSRAQAAALPRARGLALLSWVQARDPRGLT